MVPNLDLEDLAVACATHLAPFTVIGAGPSQTVWADAFAQSFHGYSVGTRLGLHWRVQGEQKEQNKERTPETQMGFPHVFQKKKTREKVEEREKKQCDKKEGEARKKKKVYNPLGFMGCV